MFYWSGLDKEPSCTREDYRGAIRDFYGDIPLIQLPLKVFELRLRLAYELTGCGYDGRFIRIESHLNVL
jgi:hypothetical protein